MKGITMGAQARRGRFINENPNPPPAGPPPKVVTKPAAEAASAPRLGQVRCPRCGEYGCPNVNGRRMRSDGCYRYRKCSACGHTFSTRQKHGSSVEEIV